ncbi:BapA/Bap/LapF family large adhesin [Sphingobium abikonense]|uniref:BapA/Bap/LapF family large adhesin n=1 Tax=Sphingobium abikonense TaxID=86193 RepID=UPI0035113B80
MGEPDARIEIRSVDGVLIGSGMADADGSYAITLDPPLDNGETVQVTQIDAAGNVSAPTLAIAPDLTAPAIPDATLDGPASVSGTGEPGATVTVSASDGTVLGTAQVGTDGSFIVSLSAPQTDGETLSVTQRDAAGNESDPVLLIAPDTTAPDAPTATIAGDGLTVTGAGEPGATVRVFGPGGALIGSATVLGDGSYTIVLDEAQTNGQMLTAIQTDMAGNASDPVGLTAPDLDAPLAPAAAITPDGAILTGSGEIGATIEVRDADGTLIGTDTVRPNGSYSITLTPPLVDGESVTVVQIDAAGNMSDPTEALAPDLTAPEAPTGSIAADGGSISGSGEIGATIRVRDASGAVIGTATVDSDGNYRVDFDPALTDGEALSVTQSDAAGNVSPDIDLIAPDFTPPPAPSATIDGTGSVVTGTVVTSEGVAGSIIEVRDADGTLLGTATVDAQGNYTVMLDTPQVDGEALAVTQVDGAGNVSDPTPIIAPDLTAPDAPTGLIAADGGSISGTGEIGATIRVRDATGAVIGTATVDSDGNYRVDFDPALTDGEALSVTQSDAAGNVSPDIDLIAPDLTAPPPPTATIGAQGAVVTGKGVAGASIEVRSQDGALLGTATVNAQGNYAVSLSPPQVDSEPLTVTQIDGAGNVSDPVDLIAPDLTPPAPPTADIAGDGASMSGTGEVGATITITDPVDVVIGTATVNADGDWTATLTPAQVHGEPLTVVQSDAAGNDSTDVTVVAPDLSGPDAPDPVTATISADGAVVSGSGEPLATVTVTGPGGIPLGIAQVDGDGNYSITLDTPQRDGETLVLVQTDAEGNSSVPALVTAPDLTAPEAPMVVIDDSGSVVTGTGEAGAAVTVRDAGGIIIGTATVDGQGNYAVILNPAQDDGSTLSVTQTDAAGNESDAMMVLTPDLVAPDAPTGIVAADGGAVTGSGEAGATISVTDAAGNVLGTDIVDGNGTYSVALTPPLTDGEPLTVVQTDAAGNVSPSISLVAPDLTAPDAPTGTVTPDGTVVTGTGEAGATIDVTDPDGAVIGTATVGANGNYIAVLASPQVNGETLGIVQTDAAGNISDNVDVIAPDITAPNAPTGVVNGDGTVVDGTGEPGATIRITDPQGVVIGTATVAANGTYSATLTTPQVNGETLAVVQADASGNASPSVPTIAPDLTAPAAPTGTVTSDGTVVTGTGEAGATIRITSATGQLLATAIVAANGSYSATLSTPQVDGESLTLVQADAAGNISPPVPLTAPDITAPDAPTAAIAVNGGSVTGTGEADATVTVRDADGMILGTGVVAAGGSFTVTLSPAQRNGEALSVTQTDGAGNESGNVPLTAPDLTAPDAPTAIVSANGATVTGTGEAGATITITNEAGVIIGTALVAANGSYTVVLTTPQANGQTIDVIQTDTAGNVSPETSVDAPDVTAPPAPANLAIDDSGTVVTGIGEAGATVEVRDGTGTLIGTGVIAANGSFLVTLSSPQVGGEDLTVTQTDLAGNQSDPGIVGAPFDIVAFDNSTIALVDLLPVTTPVNHGNASYVALVSLDVLDLDAQALGTPSVGFTVADGHSLNAVFTYDATLSIGVLSGYSVAVQQWNGSQWVAVDGGGGASLLELTLLNGNLVSTEALGPGQYRAFVTFNNTLGVGLLGSLNVSGTDADFTDIGSVVPQQIEGNVITDAGPAGQVDIVSPQTEIQSVTVNGVTTAVTADGTVVNGAFGRLIIDLDGSYSYTPSASAAAIGKTDMFQYTLIDRSDGETETANLSITISSDDITAAPIANDDSATAGAQYRNVVETVPTSQEFAFNTPILSTRSGNDNFSIAANSEADITITVIRGGTIALLPTYTITVRDGAGQVVDSYTGTTVAGLPLGSGITHTFEDLPSGNYTYTVSSTNLLGTAYSSTVYISQSITHLDQFEVADVTGTQGDLLANDVTGTDFPIVKVGTGSGFVEVGDTPVTLQGSYGALTVTETGDYSYTPRGTIPYSTVDLVDSFTYQIVQPNGVTSTATLNVTIDVGTGVTGATILAEPSSLMMDEAVLTSDESMVLPSASPEAELSIEDDTMARLSSADLIMAATEPETGAIDPGDQPALSDPDAAASLPPDDILGELAYEMFEGQGQLEDVLTAYLDRQPMPEQVGLTASADEGSPHSDVLTSIDVPQDPLAYLAPPEDLDKHTINSTPQI